MKILQLANKFPYPPKDGGSIATLSMSKTFAELGNETTVLAMNTSKHYFPLKDLPASLSDSVEFLDVAVDTRISWYKMLLNFIFSRNPYNAVRFISPDFENKLLALLRERIFDVIQLEGLYLAPYIPTIRANSRALIAMRAHNVEHEIWLRTALQCKGLRKYYLMNLAKRIRRMELLYLNAYDALIPITQRDADIFVGMACKLPVHVAPIGVSTASLKPERDKIEFPSLFHIGALDWAPNQEGIFWFLERIWDHLQRANPNLKFYIAGRNAPDKISKIRKKNVVFLGEVEDAYQFMNSKAIMVVPLLSGSGMRIKIIEGMALGKTIISTPIGAEGIQCRHGENIIIADTPQKFTEEIQSLLNNFDKFDTIGVRAMEFVYKTYDNTSIMSDLLEFYKMHLK